MTREEKKIECVRRMELLNISKNVIKEFKNHDVLNESEGIGALYWLNDEEKKMVEFFEKNNVMRNPIVYHLIHTTTEFGELYAMLFVNDEKSEWAREFEDLKEGYCFCYVFNKDADWCSEFGTIGIRQSIGGLVRTF